MAVYYEKANQFFDNYARIRISIYIYMNTLINIWNVINI